MPPQKTILHIEDNFENRVLVRRLLQSADYQVLEAENALQAINHLRRVRPDLILMDINMPDVDGYTLTSKLKTIPGIKQIPIVAITANAMRGDREKTLRAGCDGYIEKPIDIDTFLDKVAYFLRPATHRGEING
jgi:two-component system cell cycle response regulator DivK